MRAGQRENKVRHYLLCTLLMVGCAAMVLCMSACGKEEVAVTIEDGQSETEVTAYVGDTVAEVLETAEITVGDGDIVTPELSYELQSGDDLITIEREVTVTIIDGEDTYEVSLVGETVQDALDEADIELGEDDEVEPEPDTDLTDGMEITISRCHEVTLTVDGKESKVKTTAETVGDLLEEEDIEIGEDDEVSEELDTKLEDGMEIIVKRTITEEEVEEEEVPYETEYEYSSSMYEDQSSVEQEGVNGTKEVTYEVTYENGEEVSREAVSEEVTKDPVNRVILQGTKEYETQSYDSGSSESYSSGSSSSSSSSSGGGGGSSDSGSSGGGDSGGGRTVVSQQAFYDCDGSGHGYYEITYSDGSVEYQDF